MLQIPLVPLPPLEPLPTTASNYVPVLLDKSGERLALSNASPDAWARMTPLVVVTKHGDHPTRNSLRGRMRALYGAVGAHPVYLDLAADIPPCKRIQLPDRKERTLAVLYEEARRAGLAFMPVATSADRPCRLEVVGETAEHDGHGLALRHKLGGAISSSRGSEERIGQAVDAAAVDARNVDLVLDLGFLDPDQHQSARWVVREIERIDNAAPWRSMVLVATSVPKSIAEIAKSDAMGSSPRREWSLWQEVAKQVSRPLAYGDYVIQNPSPPKAGWRGLANVRYTRRSSLLVSRGHDFGEMSDGDIAGMCRRITSADGFEGASFSWGDRMVAERASRRASVNAINDDWDTEEPEEPDRHHLFWRAVGTSHHLELIAQQLKENTG